MPLSNKEVTILPNDIIFNHAGATLVLSIRTDPDEDINIFVGVKDGDTNKSSFYWGFGEFDPSLSFEEWIEARGVLPIMNREIQAVYGAFEGGELLLWEQLAAFFKGNYSFDNASGFIKNN